MDPLQTPQNSNEMALLELEKTLHELNSTPTGRRSFILALPVLLAACAAPQKTRYREGDNTGQATEITVEDEKRMTQEVLPKMRQEYPPIADPEMQTYITNLGNKISTKNGLEGNPYQYNYTVVGAKFVNAFALPAGTIYVTAPLIEMADSEAELAGVVGHEVGHVQARHAAERIDRAKKEQNKTLLYGVVGGLLGGAAGFGLGKLMCPPKDNECLAKAAALGAAAGAGGGLLIQKFAFMANSREDEMEADRIGFRTSVASHYHKNHVGDFYNKLHKMEQSRAKNNTPLLGSLADAMSTHPPSQERVNQMNELAAATPAKPNAITSSRDFDYIRQKCRRWMQSQGLKTS